MLSGDSQAGIIGIQVYIPNKYVDQTELEQFDGVSSGKYTIGLGQHKMAFVDDSEDINSICLTVVKNLLEKYNIDPSKVGRLEVGTETIIDKAKSVKTVLMSLFKNNTDIEGIDTTNACYGGTNAIFNSINWLESKSWDGRYAIAVAADIAVYKNGGARPTGGAGAVAILLGRDAPIVFDEGMRVSHMDHQYDFYKPDLHSEYPEVDGPLSNKCYTRSLDICYQRYMAKLSQTVNSPSIDSADYFLFHSPYTKLVQKSFGRLAYNDFLKYPDLYPELQQFRDVSVDASLNNKELEKAFMNFTKQKFNNKVSDSLLCAKNMGNTYTASLYFCLASLISSGQDLVGKKFVLFSYGSGLSSSMFSLTVKKPVDHIAAIMNIPERLNQRTKIAPEEFDKTLQLREKTHNVKDYVPLGGKGLFPGTFYLEKVDEKFRRTYSLK
ncbi:hypothetical protein HDV01_000427 [Terramyces sp. JEL0728]|nr:hypothetical protein HDV01_000427 [Terramyces sp. JEL0728]